MKSYIINKNDSDQRVDKFITKKFPTLPKSLLYKEIRKKNIKVNKKRTTPDYKLREGDFIELYLKDDVLIEKAVHYDFMNAPKNIDIIYEDENIILVDKKVGMLCHSTKGEYTNTVISSVKRYLFEKGEWNPKDENSFSPALANRLDRNTGGIIIVAKNASALRILNEAIKTRAIKKYYLCAVEGTMPKKEKTLKAYLVKDETKNKVQIYDKFVEGSKEIITKYTVLDSYNNKSLLEIELKTGRTHQIRAHLAHIGHPIINDGKYGSNQGRRNQALCSYKLTFNIDDDCELSYLNGKTFEIKNCEVQKNFAERKY